MAKHFGYLDCFRTIYKLSELSKMELIFAGSTGSISVLIVLMKLRGSDFFPPKPTPSAMNGNQTWRPYQDFF